MRRKTFAQASAVLHWLAWSTGALAQPSPSPPPSFSADIVSRDSTGARIGATAKLHVANRKARIEVAPAADEFFISDTDAGTALFVRPAQRLYLDARQSTALTRIFVRVDSRDPCPQWQAAAVVAGVNTSEWRCEPIDRAVVDQRPLIEYRVQTADRQDSYGWVDLSLGFPVKWQAADGRVFVLENIVFEVRPASLFSVPPGYRKLDPRALVERIKHSDVWADSPK